MPHRNAVIDGNGVKFGGETAEFLYFFLDYLSRLVQMGMAGNELGKGVGYGNDRLAELLALHSVSHPESP